MKSTPKRRTLARLYRRSVAKAAPSGTAGYAWGGGPLWADAYQTRRGPTPYELVESYKSLIFFCARTNYKAVGRAPFRLFLKTDKGQKRAQAFRTTPVSKGMTRYLRSRDYLAKSLAGSADIDEVNEHPILDGLRDPNPLVSDTMLVEYICCCLDIIGYAYLEPVWKTAGRIRTLAELWSLPAHMIFPIPSGTTLIPQGFQFYAKRYALDELIWFRYMSLRNPYMDGMSPARAAIMYAKLEDAFISIQDNVLDNGPRPSLIVSHKDAKGSFGDRGERERTRAEIIHSLRGGRSGGVAIVDGALSVTPVTYPLADVGSLQISTYDLERTANCFDIPLPMLSKETNLANMQAGTDLHAVNAVEPRHKLIASTFTRYFHQADQDGRLGWQRLFFAFDPVAPEDKKLLMDFHKTYWDMGVLTTNEVRTELNYPPVEGGDVLTVKNNLTTLDRIINPPEPPPGAEPEPGLGAEPGPGPGKKPSTPGQDREDPDDEEADPEAKALATALRVLERLEAAWEGEDRRPFPRGQTRKANPNHDAHGRFAEGSGSGGGSAALRAQADAHRAGKGDYSDRLTRVSQKLHKHTEKIRKRAEQAERSAEKKPTDRSRKRAADLRARAQVVAARRDAHRAHHLDVLSGNTPAAPGHRAPRKPPARLEADRNGTGSESHAKAVELGLAQLSPRTRGILEKAGVTVHAPARVKDVPGENWGQATPPGYPPGTTDEHIGGVYIFKNRRVIVPERHRDPFTNEDHKTSNVPGTTLHEVGHAYDHALAGPGATHEGGSTEGGFLSAYLRDAGQIPAHMVGRNAYFLQDHGIGASEAFAEGFANVHGFGIDHSFREFFPRVTAYMEAHHK